MNKNVVRFIAGFLALVMIIGALSVIIYII